MLRRAPLLVLMVLLAAACTQDRQLFMAPFGPSSSTPPAISRVVKIVGTLDFGLVDIGKNARLTVRVQNTGNDTLDITAITIPVGYTTDWNSGTIPPGAGTDLTVTFAPEDPRSYAGLLVVSGNYTGGTDRIAVSGGGRLAGSE